MRALITGGSGYIGQALTERLRGSGEEIVHLVRREPNPDADVVEVRWDTSDPDSVDVEDLGRVDAVFNLAGAAVAKRWTKSYLELISSSRIVTTETLVEICRRMEVPPNVLITTSGVAIYGDRGDEQLTESSARGEGILADIAVPWEAATESASEFGVRTSTVRFGVVMSGDGGPLPRLAKPFRRGLGGRLGNGRQWTPWIHLDDSVSALLFIVGKESLDGAVNVVSPGVVRNSDLTRAIGDALGKPSFGWMPAIVARIVIGNYVQELAINSALVIPEKLMEAGFEFEYRDLRACLEHELGETSKQESSEYDMPARSVGSVPEVRTPEVEPMPEVVETFPWEPTDIRGWGKRKWQPKPLNAFRSRKRSKWRPKPASAIRSR